MKKISYIAFLRGINVGGHIVKMQHLRELFEQLGFSNVSTYIQSGNIAFATTETDIAILQNKIEKFLFKELGYQVPTFVRTIEQLKDSLASAPFKEFEPTPNTRHFVMFTSGELPNDLVFPVFSLKKDFEIVGVKGNDIFVILHLDVGKPGNPVEFIEKKFNVKSTSRFYHTLVKILQSFSHNLNR